MQGEFIPLGSISPGRSIPAGGIQGLLEQPETTLTHGSSFSGRPITRVIANSDLVLKLRPSRLELQRLVDWVESNRDREARLDVHPPGKTWFVLHDGERAWRGNAASRLTTLAELAESESSERLLDSLLQLPDLYLGVGAQHGYRLDEGLSNFGVDAEGRLYYLDDDLFSWSGPMPLAQALGVLLRALTMLEPQDWVRLGQAFRDAFQAHFPDPQLPIALGGLLEETYLHESHEPHRERFLEGLLRKEAHSPGPTWPKAERLGLLADIHANLPALEAALEALAAAGADHFLVLGDLVGYGPHPAAVIERLHKLGRDCTVIKGNHDHAAGSGYDVPGMSRDSRQVIHWTREQLTSEQLRWLDELPPVLRGDGIMAVHGAPVDPYYFYAYVYRRTFEDNLAWMAEHGQQICFHGHSHIRGIYLRDSGGTDFSDAPEQDLSRCQGALICPGSVGQPRDRRPGAACGLFNTTDQSIRFFCPEYPLQDVVQDMRDHGLPARLSDRLLQNL